MTFYDGHIHTPYCPHGSSDSLSGYIERAIELGYTGMTFTEHAPLPSGFIDPVPDKDSAMKPEHLDSYLKELAALKKEYQKAITINIGLEVDFIEGWEKETKSFLEEIGPRLTDSILSVHFLKHGSTHVCIDFSEESFEEIAASLGGVDNVYDLYFQTVARSITADLGAFKPKRIGHMTLVHKFQKAHPPKAAYQQKILNLLRLVKTNNAELDYNAAGLFKPDCLEPYPPNWVIEEAQKQKIPLVYGSDAHSIKGLGQGFEQLLNSHLSTPLARK